jgi:D-sedoheptulose 7-phosphate isomerase
MVLQRIQQQFLDSADLLYQCSQTVAPAVEVALRVFLTTVTAGGKVLALGNGASSGLAQSFVSAFVGRFERERPELAALTLDGHASLLTGLYHAFDVRAVYARQVRALGMPGDVLLLVTTWSDVPEVLAVVEAAHQREMTVVAVVGSTTDLLTECLHPSDVLIRVPTERLSRLHEAQQLVLHCICDGMDAQLLGEQDFEGLME